MSDVSLCFGICGLRSASDGLTCSGVSKLAHQAVWIHFLVLHFLSFLKRAFLPMLSQPIILTYLLSFPPSLIHQPPIICSIQRPRPSSFPTPIHQCNFSFSTSFWFICSLDILSPFCHNHVRLLGSALEFCISKEKCHKTFLFLSEFAAKLEIRLLIILADFSS